VSEKSWDTMEGREVPRDHIVGVVGGPDVPEDLERVTLPVPWAPGHTITGPRKYAQRFLDEHQLQRVARSQWPQGIREQMEALARLFPCFAEARGEPELAGVIPWDPIILVRSLNTSGVATSVRHAALFLLSIWNSSDWSLHGLRVRKREKGSTYRRIGRFDFADAWSNWDHEHRAAALAWLANPFFP
jgi:hypothetical protein